jgi:crotonobetainyl-CoA:carnitine CoA-transferase CaiB-like acyl-CoA transferase
VLLASLLRRDADGVGRQLDVSQVEATIHFLAPQIADYVHNGVVAERSGNRDVAMSPNGVYACIGDDETWIAITARTDAEWRTLAMFVGGADLSADERFHSLEGRKANEDLLESILRAWAARQDADDLEVRLQALGIAAHKVARSADLVKDPQLASDGFFIPLDHPKHGSVTVEGSRFTLSSTPAQINRAGPMQGQDTELVMSSILDYDRKKIEQLRAANAFE